MAIMKKRDTVDLFAQLETVLINLDEKAVSQIDSFLAEHGILRGTINEILVNRNILSLMVPDELALVVLAVYDATKDETILPAKFYSKKELDKAKKYVKQLEVMSNFPIVHQGVLSGSDQDYMTKVSYQHIKSMWESGIWSYNYASQRNSVKKVNKEGTILEKPKLNKKSVNEIKQLMIENKYKPDTIVINLLMDGDDSLLYDESEMELHIESGEINLIDGFHRVQAVISALEEQPELEGYLYLSIRNYDLETARYFLGQHNSFNTFDKTHVRQLKSLNISDKIVEDLNVKSDLRGRITTSTSVKKKFNEITNFAVLSDTIKAVFDPKTGKDRLVVSAVLIRFFDFLLGSYPEAFVTKVEETSKTSWMAHHNSFVGYVVLAKKLYDIGGKDFNLDDIVRVVDSINFSKESGEYNDLLSSQGKINSNQVKAKIRKFFEDIEV